MSDITNIISISVEIVGVIVIFRYQKLLRTFPFKVTIGHLFRVDSVTWNWNEYDDTSFVTLEKEIDEWCSENILRYRKEVDKKESFTYYTYCFLSKKDMAKFKLRWDDNSLFEKHKI